MSTYLVRISPFNVRIAVLKEFLLLSFKSPYKSILRVLFDYQLYYCPGSFFFFFFNEIQSGILVTLITSSEIMRSPFFLKHSTSFDFEWKL